MMTPLEFVEIILFAASMLIPAAFVCYVLFRAASLGWHKSKVELLKQHSREKESKNGTP